MFKIDDPEEIQSSARPVDEKNRYIATAILSNDFFALIARFSIAHWANPGMYFGDQRYTSSSDLLVHLLFPYSDPERI
jgi:hypothetical protein